MKTAIPKTVGGKRPGAGRPATGKDPVRTMRLSDEFMNQIDGWAAKQPDKPGRSEAIRRLVEMGLTMKSKIQVEATDLKAALSLLKAYDEKEKRGAHFKDDEQRLRDGFYAVRVSRLENALAPARKGKPK